MNREKATAGRRLRAAALLIALPLPGRAALVTKIVPVLPSSLFLPAAEVPRELPETSSCLEADQAVRDLESSVLEAKAQHWAYMMSRPDYKAAGEGAKPGADIVHADLRSAFYRSLAMWSSLETVPDLPASSLSRINDVSARIRLVLDVCRQAERPTI
jgi:hypothetical protein